MEGLSYCCIQLKLVFSQSDAASVLFSAHWCWDCLKGFIQRYPQVGEGGSSNCKTRETSDDMLENQRDSNLHCFVYPAAPLFFHNRDLMKPTVIYLPVLLRRRCWIQVITGQEKYIITPQHRHNWSFIGKPRASWGNNSISCCVQVPESVCPSDPQCTRVNSQVIKSPLSSSLSF